MRSPIRASILPDRSHWRQWLRSVHNDCMGCGIEPRKVIRRRGREFFTRSKAICAAPSVKGGEVLTPCRGLRPHHVQKDRIGSWEISDLTGMALPLPAASGR